MARLAIPLDAIAQGTEPSAKVTGVAADDLKLTPSALDDIIFLEMENTGGSDRTVTVVTSATSYGIPLEDVAVVITAGERRLYKLYPLSIYVQSDGDVYINIANDTDLKFVAFK